MAEKIIGRNLTLPILSNILIEAEKGGLKISATNLEIGLVAKIRAKVEREGKIAIPGRIVGAILSQLEDGNKIVLEGKVEKKPEVKVEKKEEAKKLEVKDKKK